MEDAASIVGFVKAVWEHSGWWGVLGLILCLLVVFTCWEFLRSFVLAIFDRTSKLGGFGGKLQRLFLGGAKDPVSELSPANHSIFIRLKNLIENQVPNMNITCRLRKKLFTELLLAFLEATRSCLTSFVAEIETAPEENLPSMFELLFAKIERTWRSNLENKGYPEVAVRIFLRDNAVVQKHLAFLAIDMLNSSSFTDHNFRIIGIMDGISSSLYTSIMNMERGLSNANGEISGLSYQGVKCDNCDPVCKYSKNHLKTLHRLELAAEAERTSQAIKLVNLDDTNTMRKAEDGVK